MINKVIQLLDPSLVPESFKYPFQFLRLVELGITQLEPWWILEGERLQERQIGIKTRYSERNVVLFAERQDNDDVACWDLEQNDIAIIHDFASPGWEQRQRYPTFSSWLRVALEDFVDWGESEDPDAEWRK